MRRVVAPELFHLLESHPDEQISCLRMQSYSESVNIIACIKFQWKLNFENMHFLS